MNETTENQANFNPTQRAQTGDKVKDTINSILNSFKTGEALNIVTEAMNPSFIVPCANYSYNNRFIIMLHGTSDARGFYQWRSVGRNVKKGEHSFYILAPMMRKIKEIDKLTGEEITKERITGFRAVPVFRAEQTEGKPLNYEAIPTPNFNFIDVAKSWGLEVKSVGNIRGGVMGCYSPSSKSITMYSPEEKVFYHELAHASHDRIGKLKARTKEQREIVAEFSSVVIAKLLGIDAKIGNTYAYLQNYSKGSKVENAVLKMINDIMAVIDLILKTDKELKSKAEATAFISGLKTVEVLQ